MNWLSSGLRDWSSFWGKLIENVVTERLALCPAPAPRRGCARRQRLLERLEERAVPAYYSLNQASNTLSIDLGTNESLHVSTSGTDTIFTLETGNFFQAGTDSATGDSTNTLTVASADFVDSFSIVNTSASGGLLYLYFEDGGSLLSGAITVNVAAAGVVSHIWSNDFSFTTTGSGNLAMEATRNITLNSSTLTTVDGDITLKGNQGATATSGISTGVDLYAVTIQSTTGDVTLLGRGGTLISNNIGVRIRGQSVVGMGTTGNVTVTGQGGGSSSSGYGVYVYDSGSRITSGGGNVSVTGTGGGTSSGANNYGVYVNTSGEISAGGTGTVTVTGTGGNTSSSSNFGIRLDGTNSKITSSGGDITVVGTARCTNSAASGGAGLYLGSTASIVGVGNANVTIRGQGSAGVTSSYGVTLPSSAAQISAEDGNISIEATAGSYSVDAIYALGTIRTVATGDITIAADKMTLSVVNASVNTVTLKTKTSTGSVKIGLGLTSDASTLGISTNLLSAITAGTLVIGDESIANTIAVSGAFTSVIDTQLVTARNIVFQAGSSWISSTSDLLLRANQGTNATSGDFIGIDLDQATLESSSGDITLQGRGGNGAAGSQYGVRMVGGGTVGVGTSGTVTVEGRGGASAGNSNFGVLVDGASSAIISATGSLGITGTGGGAGTSDQNYGVALIQGGSLSTSGIHSLTVTATGGTASGIHNHGLYLADADSKITNGFGGLTIHAIAGNADSLGIELGSNTLLRTDSNGALLVWADRINLDGAITTNGGPVTLRQYSSGGTIGIRLGGADDATHLGLTADELARITAPKLTIGDATSGAITVSANFVRSSATDITLRSGDAIAISGGQIDTHGGTLEIIPGESLAVGHAGIDLVVDDFALDGDLQIAIGGTTLDTDYSQLKVDGDLDLNGADLVLDGSFSPSGGVFTIVAADNVTGQFHGLSDGDTITFNGKALTIHYTASSVTLTAGEPDLEVEITAPAVAIVGGYLQYTLTIRNVGSADAAQVSLSDVLPPQVTLVSQTQLSGPTFLTIAAGGTITSTIASLASGASASFAVLVQVSPNLTGSGVIHNTVGVSSSTSDPVSSNDSDSVQTSVLVCGFATLPNGADPTKTDLYVGGSHRNDMIRITTASGGRIQVSMGAIRGTFTVDGTIYVYGRGGDDQIQLTAGVNLDAVLDGGLGNDRLSSGSGNDILLGGAGRDSLAGGRGRNLLIGGVGKDVLFSTGCDILIGGTTTFDLNNQALQALLSEWESASAPSIRMANLRGTNGPTGLNGNHYLTPNVTVVNDGAVDNLVGNPSSRSWFFADLASDAKDKLTGKKANEWVETLA